MVEPQYVLPLRFYGITLENNQCMALIFDSEDLSSSSSCTAAIVYKPALDFRYGHGHNMTIMNDNISIKICPRFSSETDPEAYSIKLPTTHPFVTVTISTNTMTNNISTKVCPRLSSENHAITNTKMTNNISTKVCPRLSSENCAINNTKMTNNISTKACPKLSTENDSKLAYYKDMVMDKEFDVETKNDVAFEMATLGDRKTPMNRRIKQATQLIDSWLNVCAEIQTGPLQFVFLKHESLSAPRDTSTKIAYNSKKNVPSRTIGNVDKRVVRQKCNFEKPAPGPKLPSNPLPPTRPAAPKNWLSRKDREIEHREKMQLAEDRGDWNSWHTYQQPNSDTPYEFGDVWDDDDDAPLMANTHNKAVLDDFLFGPIETPKQELRRRVKTQSLDTPVVVPKVVEEKLVVEPPVAPQVLLPAEEKPLPEVSQKLAARQASFPPEREGMISVGGFVVEKEADKFHAKIGHVMPGHSSLDYLYGLHRGFYVMMLRGQPETLRYVYACDEHCDKNTDECKVCMYGTTAIPKETYELEEGKFMLHYSNRKGLYIATRTTIKTQGADSPFFKEADPPKSENSFIHFVKATLTSVRNVVLKYLVQMSESVVNFLQKKLAANIWERVKKLVMDKIDILALAGGLSSVIYDMFTDTRELSLAVIASYTVRFLSFGPAARSLFELIRAACLRDDDGGFEVRFKRTEDGEETVKIDFDAQRRSPDQNNLGDVKVEISKPSTSAKAEAPKVSTQSFDFTTPFDYVLSFVRQYLPRLDRDSLVKVSLFNGLSTAAKTVKNLAIWLFSILPAFIQRWFQYGKPGEWRTIRDDPKGLFTAFIKLSHSVQAFKTDRVGIPSQAISSWRSLYLCLLPYMDDEEYEMTTSDRNLIKSWHRELANVEAEEGEARMEPLWIYLYGASKIGKSKCAYGLMANILGKSVKDASKHIYNRNCASEYWDAYNSDKTITFFDDLGAINSPIDPHKDLTEMICLVSPVPYMLPMATIDDPSVGKKGTYFTSDTIVSCSNRASYEVDELTHKPALINRMHERIHVYAKPGIPFNLATHEHLRFEVKARGGDDKDVICDSNCARTHKREIGGDVLCPNMKPTLKEMTFNQISRYLYLRRSLKLKFSACLQASTLETDRFQKYNKALSAHDDLFLKTYLSAKNAPIPDEDGLFYNDDSDDESVSPKAPYFSAKSSIRTQGDFYDDMIGTSPELQAACRALDVKNNAAFVTVNGVVATAIGFMVTTGTWAAIRYLLPKLPAKVENFFMKFFKIVGAVATVITAGLASASLVSAVQAIIANRDVDTHIQEFIETLEFKTESFELAPKSRANRTGAVIAQSVRTNGDEDEDTIPEIQPPPGCVLIHVTSDVNPSGFLQNAFVVSGYHLITTKHCFLRHTNAKSFNINVKYCRRGRNYEAACAFAASDLTFHSKLDLVEIDIKRMEIMPFRNWRSHLLPSGTRVPEAFEGTMYVWNKDFQFSMYNGYFRAENEFVAMDTATKPESEYLVTRGYATPLVTTDGFCGAIVFDKQYRIMGMHVAAYTHHTATARSITFTEEDLSVRSDATTPHISTQSDEHPWNVLETNVLIPIGRLEKSMVQYQSTKTSIRKSIIHDKIRPHTTEPAVLSPGDPRLEEQVSPLFVGISKYTGTPAEMDFKRLKRSEEVVEFYWNKAHTGIKPGILTEDEALNGIIGVPHVKGIDMSTSCGFGYPKGNGKRDHVSVVDGHYVVSSPILRERIDNLWNDLEHSVVVPIVVDSLKDERRKLEKIRTGKTRIFNIFPQEFTIVMTRLFGRAVAHFMELSKTDSPFCVGIDPYSDEWHDKVMQLISNSVLAYDGDGAKYDADYMLRSLVYTVLQPIIRWILTGIPKKLQANYKLKLENAAMSCRTVVHLCQMFAFFTARGTLSGEKITTMLNSLCMLAHTYNAYCDSVPVEYQNIKTFDENISMLIFGDDHVVSVASMVRPYFGFQQMKSYCEMFGFKYTPGIKDNNELRNHWNLYETTFLKNRIGRLGEKYVALMDEEVLYEMTNWITKTDNPEQATIDNVQTALRMWYFYGQSHFNAVREQFKSVLPQAPLFTFEELDDIYCCHGGWADTFSPYHDRSTNLEQLTTTMSNNTFSIGRPGLSVETQSAIMDLVAPFAKIVDGIIPHEIQKDALGMLGDLDRPTFPDTISKTRMQFAPNMNAVKGVDTSVPLRLDPSSMTMVDGYHFRRGKQTRLNDLWSIPTTIPIAPTPLYQTINWLGSQAIGTSLFVELVGPNTELQGPEFFTTAGQVPTALTYLTKPFVNWTGSINYEVEAFASNGFHQGSLRISFFPGIFDLADIPSATDKSSVYYTIMNISDASSKTRFTVPYIAQYPWLEIANGLATTRATTAPRFTGLLVVSVAKQLRASGNASPDIRIVVRKSGGPDFAVANMSMHNASIQLAPSAFEVHAFTTQSAPAASAETMNVAQVVGTIGTATAVDNVDVTTTNSTTPETIQPNHPRVQQAIGECGWTMQEAANKQTLFASVDWTDAELQSHILGAWDLPSDALVCKLGQIVKERFVNLVSDITIQAEISSSRFQSGALALVWMPLISKANFTVGSVDNGFLSTLTQIDFTQHLIMKAGLTTTYKMNVQMIHPQSALYLAAGDSLGTLLLVVYSQQPTIVGAPAINVLLHATLDNAHVTTPLPCLDGLHERPPHMLNKMSQIAEINELEESVARIKIAKVRTQASTATAPTLDTVSVPTQMNPTNTPIPTQQPQAVVLGKLPNQKITSSISSRGTKVAPHFEDIVYDINTLCKKYSNASIVSAATEPDNAVNFYMDVANTICFPDGTGRSNPNNGGGLIGWYAPLFRGFRGDVRIKACIRIEPVVPGTQVEAYGYVNMAYGRLGTTGIGSGLEAFDANAMLTLPIGPPYMTPSNPHQHNFIVTTAIPEWLEIEIPYVHLGQFMIPPSYSGFINGEPYSLGTLNWRFVATSACIIIVRTFVALGDAAHFGLPTTLPRISVVTGNYPDYYPPVPPVPTVRVKQTKQPLTDTDDDFETIVVQKSKRAGRSAHC